MNKDPKALEREAYALLAQEKLHEAFHLFRDAAVLYSNSKDHKEAALCFSCAAGCWEKEAGERIFHNAALSYEDAAREAASAFDLEYASVLYKYAAINYERDMESGKYSECFYLSKESHRKYLYLSLISSGKISNISSEPRQKESYNRRLAHFLASSVSWLVWGYGERPFRALGFGIAIILLSAFGYWLTGLKAAGTAYQSGFLQSLYFSVVTFTTVGYGDVTPAGLSKVLAMTEALASIFIMPIFVVGLSRKFLRI